MSVDNILDLGIDIGITNSCAFLSKGGSIECLEENGNFLFPSVVEYIDGIEPIVGFAAKRHAETNTASVVYNIKRLIGCSYSSDEVQQNLINCGCPIENHNGFPVFYIKTTDSYVTPDDVVAEIIKKLVNRAELQAQCKVSNICITVPSYFNENQRFATLHAALNCGIPKDHISILNESVAVVLSCEPKITKHKKSEFILVYDIGENSIDISILKLTDHHYSVVIYDSDSDFGSTDYLMIIVDWITKRYRELNCSDLVPETSPLILKTKFRRRLRYIAENAMIKLLESSATKIDVSSVTTENTDEAICDFILDHKILGSLLESNVNHAIEMIKKMLSKVQLTKNAIGTIIMISRNEIGRSVLSCIRDKFENLFGTSRIIEADQKCIAEGACLALVKNYHINDITAYSIGQLLIGNRVQCIIPMFSQLPIKMSVISCTTIDNQESVTTAVFLGKQYNTGDEVDVSQTIPLTSFTYSGFRCLPARKVEFRTTYEILESGIVFVTVVEIDTNRVLHYEKLKWK